MAFTPTAEQEAIRAQVKEGGDTTITARAGSGKSSTLKLLARDAPKTTPILYLVFNKAMQLAAEGDFPRNTNVRTIHSIAYRNFLGTQYGNRLPGKAKQPFWPAWKLAKWLRARDVEIDDDRPLTSDRIASLTKQTVERFCNSDADEPGPQHVPRDIPNLSDPAAMSVLKRIVTPHAQRMWSDLVRDTGELPLSHSHYLKRYVNSDPRLPYDTIYLDEAQDSNPVTIQLLKRQASHAQIITVGDRAQQLYGFRGSIGAMDVFGGTQLVLSKSFRFGDAIAKEANHFLELLKDDPPVVGFEKIDSTVVDSFDEGQTPNLILCRTNAGVLKEAMEQYQAERRVAIVGGGGALKNLAEDVERLQNGRRPKSNELMGFQNYSQLRKYAEDEAPDMLVLIKLIESHGTQAIIDFVDDLSHEELADVRVSTGHKAKGLEAPKVLVAEDFYKPKPDQGDSVVLSRADAMLLYVVVTRAQTTLALGGLRYLNEFPVVIEENTEEKKES